MAGTPGIRACVAVLLFSMTAIGAAAPEATALSAVRFRDIVGQAVGFETLHHSDGSEYAVVVAVERGVMSPNRSVPPRTQLILAPSADTTTWMQWRFLGSAALLGVGDVDGDGTDDVALGTPTDGAESCPAPVVGSTSCGAIFVLDGAEIVRGDLVGIAKVAISPMASACTPAVYYPQSIDLRDLDGDGRAELAFGMLGTYPGTCGVVHVFNGRVLEGDVTLASACAAIQGPPARQDDVPDQFGVSIGLFRAGANDRAAIAIGAPYTRVNGMGAAGGISVYALPAACGGQGLTSERVFQAGGDVPGALAALELAHADGVVWYSVKDAVRGVDARTFAPFGVRNPGTVIPVDAAGDVTNDGLVDLFLGPTLYSKTGDPLLLLEPFGQQSFRAAFIGTDQVIIGDGMGLEMWALGDVWNPSLLLHHYPPQLKVGEVVNVSVLQAISLVPTTETVSLSAIGGTVVESEPLWIHVKAVRPGEIVVLGSFLETRRLVRIPVAPASEFDAGVSGPDIVEVGEPMVAHVYAPNDATITWHTSGGSPEDGVGPRVETRYTSAGDYVIDIAVTFADGSQRALTHQVRAFANEPSATRLAIQAPPTVTQGDEASLSVNAPAGDATYEWTLEGRQIGIATLVGPMVKFPAFGWGPLNITLAEKKAGEVVRVTTARMVIENVAPTIEAIDVKPVDGFEAAVTARDRGGDPFTIQWTVDGENVGTGLSVKLDLPPGPITFGVTVTDDGGASTTETRTINITTSLIFVPKNKNGTNPAAHPIDLPITWQVDRIKGQGAEEEGGRSPAIDLVLVLPALAAAMLVRWRFARRIQ